MTVVYNDTAKAARLQAMSDLVASKTPSAAVGGALSGQLVIGTTDLSGLSGVLATIALPALPFIVSGAGTVVATLQGVPLSAVASSSGVAARAELRNAAGVTVISGLTVGTLNTDIVVTSTNFVSGNTEQVTSGVIIHG